MHIEVCGGHTRMEQTSLVWAQQIWLWRQLLLACNTVFLGWSGWTILGARVTVLGCQQFEQALPHLQSFQVATLLWLLCGCHTLAVFVLQDGAECFVEGSQSMLIQGHISLAICISVSVFVPIIAFLMERLGPESRLQIHLCKFQVFQQTGSTNRSWTQERGVFSVRVWMLGLQFGGAHSGRHHVNWRLLIKNIKRTAKLRSVLHILPIAFAWSCASFVLGCFGLMFLPTQVLRIVSATYALGIPAVVEITEFLIQEQLWFLQLPFVNKYCPSDFAPAFDFSADVFHLWFFLGEPCWGTRWTLFGYRSAGQHFWIFLGGFKSFDWPLFWCAYDYVIL